MKSFMVGLKSLFLSPWVLWWFKVVRDTAVTYMGSYGFVPTKAWAVGLGTAILSGVLHGAEAYLTSVQMANTPATAPVVAPQTKP